MFSFLQLLLNLLKKLFFDVMLLQQSIEKTEKTKNHSRKHFLIKKFIIAF